MSDSKKFSDKQVLDAMFADDGLCADYPSTNRDKADEAHWYVHEALERMLVAVKRTERFRHLLALKDLPPIIAHDEARRTLEKIDCVIADLEVARKWALEVFNSTKDFTKASGPEPDGEVNQGEH